jgi:PAS domain S-box-containing protein
VKFSVKGLLEGLAFTDGKLDPALQSLTLSDLRKPDAPLIYVNRGFERMTGYTPEETIGRNCRFLQGTDTDREAVARIRVSIAAGKPLIIDLLNYRKNGTPFWNRLSLRPVTDENGVTTHCIGIQSDITRMRSLEDRLYGYAKDLANG